MNDIPGYEKLTEFIDGYMDTQFDKNEGFKFLNTPELMNDLNEALHMKFATYIEVVEANVLFSGEGVIFTMKVGQGPSHNDHLRMAHVVRRELPNQCQI